MLNKIDWGIHEILTHENSQNNKHNLLSKNQVASSDSVKSDTVFIPLDLQKEIENFLISNVAAAKYSNGKVRIYCCQNCLKAHVLQVARNLDCDYETLVYLNDLFPCEAGHMGYYLNNGILINLKNEK